MNNFAEMNIKQVGNKLIINPRTRLTLSSFERRDEGTYFCVSKNEMGITRGNIQVFSEFHFDENEMGITRGNIQLDQNLLKQIYNKEFLTPPTL